MAEQSFLQRHHFLLRRLHSLTGIVPIGVYLMVHLTTNSSIAWGAINTRAARHAETGMGRAVATFQHDVNFINNTLPYVLLLEIFGIWLPIAFHAILGIYYARTGSYNTGAYGYRDNKRYAWQRISGYVGLIFIVYHIATLRWGWHWLVPGGTEWSHHFASSTLTLALRGASDHFTLGGIIVSLLYFFGVSLLVFHFANGLWTAAITWGVTISDAAQRRWGYVCAALGVVLMGMAWASMAGFMFAVDVEEARAVEEGIYREHFGEESLRELLEAEAYPADEASAPVEPDRGEG